MKKILKQKGLPAVRHGFTLVEMLIAMSIFVIFVGILLNSYTAIVRGQREANEYRVMYSEARRVFETVIHEFRDGMVNYEAGNIDRNGMDSIHLVSKEGVSSIISYENGFVKLQEGTNDSIALNSSDVTVSTLKFDVYPTVDPYDPANVFYNGYQFHPQVTIFATFEKEKSTGEPFTMNLQTTVSSRIYN